jgi:aspartate/methionine/tyrosine aminotransferase
MTQPADVVSRFRLKPTRAAKVSEISEATAASAVAPEERVNFHIGNPVQDARLSAAFLRAALRLDIRAVELTTEKPDDLLAASGWEDSERPVVELLIALVRRSGPYLPRGGFTRSAPSPLIRAFQEWLEHQQDPLSYDMGKTSGKREMILASGGVIETLRVFFHALSAFLVHTPATVYQYHSPLPPHITSFPGLTHVVLPESETEALASLGRSLNNDTGGPSFLLLGSVTSEEMRRVLRALSIDHPLFILEANDAPNHLSLAREAKLVDRVIRFLSPAILSPAFARSSLVFVAGNADYLALLETLHFQLKGTPSAAEVELLTYLLGTPVPAVPHAEAGASFTTDPPLESGGLSPTLTRAVSDAGSRAERTVADVVGGQTERIDALAERLAEHASAWLDHAHALAKLERVDRFASNDANEILQQLRSRFNDMTVHEDLQQSFLGAFVGHHPEYDRASCRVVSGSARTALSLLGFHCGIRDVIFPDLSWTYEHCFPSVQAVALTPEFDLDVDAILAAVDGRMTADPSWRNHGAVALNNPHNATGRIFNLDGMRRLVQGLLIRNVCILDDLSYQNVAPVDGLPDIPTVRSIADELVETGALLQIQGDRVITAHSLSKTDCMAGARLSVIEIRSPELRERFDTVNAVIRPNTGALFLAYLFYRNPRDVVRAYWRLRNQIFAERMEALATAMHNLPAERNSFGIEILPPAGSMYPLLLIHRLPAGLSLDWVAVGLARQGIGMIPLSTFARTERGFDAGRKAFRLTLGGTDGAEQMLAKTRRVLIDLNRLIAEEGARYSRRPYPSAPRSVETPDAGSLWTALEGRIREALPRSIASFRTPLGEELRRDALRSTFEREFLPRQLQSYRRRFEDRLMVTEDLVRRVSSGPSGMIQQMLEGEFSKDSSARRAGAFQNRLFDRTVHPTQMYSIRTEAAFEEAIALLIRSAAIPAGLVERLTRELIDEFIGTTVAITSIEEADEICLDLDAHITAELYGDLHDAHSARTLLSFWGDWDGSNRPSGQGHRLVGAVLLRNVGRMSKLLRMLAERNPAVAVPADLRAELERLPANSERFLRLQNDITSLTHQLERRYRGILPFHTRAGRLRRLGMALHLARDPVTSLWYHNDRLEQKMLALRADRRRALEYYFALNKKLRKTLHALLPAFGDLLSDPTFMREAVTFRDLLQRFVITPRIHQNMVTAQDPFAIDTTVFNISELNEIGARYGNPGMVLALQVSMSTKPGALIDLDRKMRARREHILRDAGDLQLPSVWLVPLFEDRDAVGAITGYCDRLWEYALQSRRAHQETHERFSEILTEVFIAGSDLSQQVSQAAGAQLYRNAKNELMHWLAAHSLTDAVRLKMGCGEPMQRQGGYYGEQSGRAAFLQSPGATRLFTRHLSASARRSTIYATTPMMGVFAGGDLRTFQSAISEQLRHLPVSALAELLYHTAGMQTDHRRDTTRASEELTESRIVTTARGKQALERLTLGPVDPAMQEYLSILTDNFRQILYGREEDVVGIHVISYFIARTTPSLRDRPTVRPGAAGKDRGNRILERIAETIPFSRYGSLLRAIAHNQAQTVVLGIPQLTTGVFRALDTFARSGSVEGDPETFIADHVLPYLPVHEILHTLRMYLEPENKSLRAVEKSFPAGNTAMLALREDLDAVAKYIPLFQQELLRRHGVEISDFFEGSRFNPELLPTLRPDLAVLLQADILNTDPAGITGMLKRDVDAAWTREFSALLALPLSIRRWRAQAWALLEQPVLQRVEAFVELAVSLHGIASREGMGEFSLSGRSVRMPSRLDSFFRAARTDDEMRQFLAAATQYLTIASEGLVEVPANIIRAMREVERIARIEEQALSSDQQDRLRCYLLQIARLTGENG